MMKEATKAPQLSTDELNGALLSLKLGTWPGIINDDVATMTPAERGVVTKYLGRWTAHELAYRNTITIASRIKSAQFVKNQTIDDFDFNYNKSTQRLRDEYLRIHHSATQGLTASCVFVGTAGLGKTHLARALGYAACQARQSTYFISAAKMINGLRTAKASCRLEAELQKYRRPRSLIIDELCYVTMDNEDSNLLFQVISARHDAELGTIATSNLPFGQWNQILSNNAIAHALVDRLTDNASVFYLEGVSYREARTKQRKK
jgi:DNA replication protein DnaC